MKIFKMRCWTFLGKTTQLLLFVFICKTSWKGSVCEAKDWFTSKANGKGALPCGSRQSPCRSLPAVIPQMNWGDRLFVDGTETIRNPYTCSMTSTPRISRIFVNKTISLIGWQSSPYLKCRNGIVFSGESGSWNNLSMHVTFLDLNYIETPVSFQNCSVRMERTLFRGTQDTHQRMEFISIEDLVILDAKFVSSIPIHLIRVRNIIINCAVFQDIRNGSLNIDIHQNGTNITLADCVFARNGHGLWIAGAHQSSIHIQDCLFTGHINTHSLKIDIDSSSIAIFDNITVEKSQITTKFEYQEGSAMYIAGGYNGGSVFEIKNSRFTNNWNTGGGAGAIYIDNAADVLQNAGCITHREDRDKKMKFSTYNFLNIVTFRNTAFENNAGKHAGAIYISNGNNTFVNCELQDNFATNRGGHILVGGGSGSLNVINSTFLQTLDSYNQPNTEFFTLTPFLSTESPAPVIIENTSMESLPFTNPTLLNLLDNGYIDVDNQSTFACPLGEGIKVLDYSHFVTERNSNPASKSFCRRFDQQIVISCFSCGIGMYSLHRAKVHDIRETVQSQCKFCPYGGNCTDNIIAMPNFWGAPSIRDPSAIEFHDCPLGYCKPPITKASGVYNGCHGNRVGTLCGSCAEGYTETLFDTDCRRTTDCGDVWFWSIAFIIVGVCTFICVKKPPIVRFLISNVFWFRRPNKDESASYGNQETTTGLMKDSSSDPGFIKIIFYFYQVAPLLVISTSTGTILHKEVVIPIIGCFNFQFKSSREGMACPFPGLKAVTKELFQTTGLFAVVLFIFLAYGVHRLVARIRRRASPSVAPYLAALTEVSLLGYATLASTALKLLVCDKIGNEKRLFLDGNTRCYQWWQSLLIVYCVIFVVPYVVVLYWGSILLSRRQLSVRQFVLASTAPLFFLTIWAIRKKKEQDTKLEEELERQAVMNILQAPFRPSKKGGTGALYWESVLIGRRFVLIVFYTFITLPSLRLTCLTILCIFFIIHHLLKKPYKNVIANTTETVSLTTLAVLGVFNTVQATFITANVTPQGPNHVYVQSLRWFEAVILVIVPGLVVVAVLFAILSQLVRCLFILVYVCQVFPPRSRPRTRSRRRNTEPKYNDGETLPSVVGISVSEADILGRSTADNERDIQTGYDNPCGVDCE